MISQCLELTAYDLFSPISHTVLSAPGDNWDHQNSYREPLRKVLLVAWDMDALLIGVQTIHIARLLDNGRRVGLAM